MQDDKFALEVLGVTKRFGLYTALDHVSFSVRPSEFVGIIGSNGAGKTTLVNLITGYQHPSEGKILVDGKDVGTFDPADTARIGIARSFQIPQLFNELTVLENVLIAQTFTRKPSRSLWRVLESPGNVERARATLAEFGLADHAEAPAGKVPQGIRKLVDIAIALPQSPSVVLLDEPTSGVSSEEKFSLMNTLHKRFRRDGTTVLFVEHDMELVMRYATKVIALYEGTILGVGTPEEVFSDPRVDAYVIGASNRAAGLVMKAEA